MKAALLSLALVGGQPVILVSDHVPRLNVEALCKGDDGRGQGHGPRFAAEF